MTTRCSIMRITGPGIAFLLLSAISGVRADGLPGEYILTTRWRDLLVAHSPVSNPAFIADEHRMVLQGAQAFVLGSEFLLSEIGVIVPMGLMHTVACTWLGEGAGEFEGYAWQPDGSRAQAGTEGNRNNLFVLSWAAHPWAGLKAGVNASMCYATNFGDPDLGGGLDLGVTWTVLHHPLLGRHRLGIGMQNPLAWFEWGETVSASNLVLSWHMRLWERRLTFGAEYAFRDLLAPETAFRGVSASDPSSLAEGLKSVERDLSLRGSFTLAHLLDIVVQAGSGYWGISAGIRMPTFLRGLDGSSHYQYLSSTDAERAITQTVYARIPFGFDRIGGFGTQSLSAEADDLYTRAMKLYYQERYWEALFLFGQIPHRFPHFPANDWVHWYLGSCLEELDMRNAADRVYRLCISRYRRSDAAPHARLGLMRIAYRNGSHRGVAGLYEKLNRPGVSDSLRFHAAYLMGQSLVRENNEEQARRPLRAIEESHPDFVFARHTLGVLAARESDLAGAVAAFSRCMEVDARTHAARQAVHRSAVMLGYLYYEQMMMSKAVTALRRVPSSSIYYTDALLGIGWTAQKSSQWKHCFEAGRALRKSGDPGVKAEGALLESYGLFMQEKFGRAASAARKGLAFAAEVEKRTGAQFEPETRRFARDRREYGRLAEKALELSRELHSDVVLRRIDSLYAVQSMLREHIDGFYSRNIARARHRFFSRTLSAVRNDLEFILAAAESAAGGADAVKTRIKAEERADELDEEMEELRRQLEELQ